MRFVLSSLLVVVLICCAASEAQARRRIFPIFGRRQQSNQCFPQQLNQCHPQQVLVPAQVHHAPQQVLVPVQPVQLAPVQLYTR